MVFGHRARRVTTLLLLLAVVGLPVAAVELEPSFFDNDLQKVRYEYASSISSGAVPGLAMSVTSKETDVSDPPQHQRKSPLKAFLLSIAVPGLGQYYYGSRTRPFLFLGLEVAAWGLHVKWHGDGDNATDVYEAYSRAHWSRQRYGQYCEWSWPDSPVPGHHLPDEETQQYFEMTGKYNQFAWGWDDATLGGDVLSDYDSLNPPPQITDDPVTIPYSTHRFEYEELRHDANRKYNRAQKMVIVSIVNRLISGFEAYFVTRYRNEKAPGKDGAFSGIDVNAQLRSYHDVGDTPYVSMAFRF